MHSSAHETGVGTPTFRPSNWASDRSKRAIPRRPLRDIAVSLRPSCIRSYWTTCCRTAVPSRALRTADVALPPDQVANGDLHRVVVDDGTTTGIDWDVLDAVRERLDETDPDVLAVNTGKIVPALFSVATDYDVPLRLGRAGGPGGRSSVQAAVGAESVVTPGKTRRFVEARRRRCTRSTRRRRTERPSVDHRV